MTDIIVDNPQAQFTGTWATSTYQSDFYGADYQFINRGNGAAPTATARWTPALPEPGEYLVAVWLPNGSSDRAPAVKYRVQHNGSESEFTLDHRLPGGEWVTLGDAPLIFTGDGQEYVEIRVADVEPASTRYIHADAVRFSTRHPLTEGPEVSTRTARNFVQLSWQPLEGADGYIVTKDDGTGPVQVARRNDTAFLDLDVQLGANGTYTVAGYNGLGAGAATTVQAATTAGVPLTAVQGLTVQLVNGRPKLTWAANRDAGWYLIQRAGTSGREFTTIARVDGTEFIDDPLVGNAHYVVRSANDHGECALSSWQVNAFGPTAATPAVEATAKTRCIADKVVIAVAVKNLVQVPITVTITTPYGQKTVPGVAPGASATHAFSTRTASVPAGEVTATASTADGAVNTVTASYGAQACNG